MRMLLRVPTVLLFSAVFLLLVLPLGTLLRAVADPMRLKRAPQRDSWLRMARVQAQCGSAAAWTREPDAAERPL